MCPSTNTNSLQLAFFNPPQFVPLVNVSVMRASLCLTPSAIFWDVIRHNCLTHRFAQTTRVGPSEPLYHILATPSVHVPGHTFTSQHKLSSFHPRTPLKSPSWCLGKTPGQCLRNVVWIGLALAIVLSLSMYTAFAPGIFILLIASPQAVNAPCQWHHFHRGPGQVKECLPWERWTWQQIFYRADFRTPYIFKTFNFFIYTIDGFRQQHKQALLRMRVFVALT